MSTPAGSVPTQLIATSGPLAVPESYRVPGSLEIQLSSVSAEYDGTGAGGSFDPTLSIYSKDGKLISRTKVGSTVTAGDSAVCTWIPFLRQQGTATPPTPGTIAALHLFDDVSSALIPSGNDQSISFAQSSSFDSTVYATHLTGGKVDRVTLKKQGVYAVFGYMTWVSNGQFESFMYNLAPFGPVITPMTGTTGNDVGAFNGVFPIVSYTRTFPAALAGDTNPSQLQFWIGQTSGINQTIANVYWEFAYLGATDH